MDALIKYRDGKYFGNQSIGHTFAVDFEGEVYKVFCTTNHYDGIQAAINWVKMEIDECQEIVDSGVQFAAIYTREGGGDMITAVSSSDFGLTIENSYSKDRYFDVGHMSDGLENQSRENRLSFYKYSREILNLKLTDSIF